MTIPTLLTRDDCPFCEKVKDFLRESEIEHEMIVCPGGSLQSATSDVTRFIAPLLNGGGRFPVLVFASYADVYEFVNHRVHPFVRKRIQPAFWWLTDQDLATWIGEKCADGVCKVS